MDTSECPDSLMSSASRVPYRFSVVVRWFVCWLTGLFFPIRITSWWGVVEWVLVLWVTSHFLLFPWWSLLLCRFFFIYKIIQCFPFLAYHGILFLFFDLDHHYSAYVGFHSVHKFFALYHLLGNLFSQCVDGDYKFHHAWIVLECFQ